MVPSIRDHGMDAAIVHADRLGSADCGGCESVLSSKRGRRPKLQLEIHGDAYRTVPVFYHKLVSEHVVVVLEAGR